MPDRETNLRILKCQASIKYKSCFSCFLFLKPWL